MTDSEETCEMLPCPLCGRQPDYQHFNVSQNTKGRIICTCGLGLTQGRNDTEDGTILKWNTRSDHAVQAANERKAEQAIVATMGNAMTLDQATEYAERFMGDYAKVLLDESTLYVERDEPTDQHAFDIAERKEAQMARDLAEALATAGVGTCTFKVVIDKDPSPRHRGNICECNKCGYRCARGFIEDERFKCCPNCGRRITKED